MEKTTYYDQAYYECHHKDILQDVIDILVEDIPNTNYNTTDKDGENLNITVNGNHCDLDKLDKRLYEVGIHPNLKFDGLFALVAETLQKKTEKVL